MDNIRYNREENELFILDQTLLPNVEEEILLDTPEKMYDAIKFLKVRGAPAIGICAGYCMAVLAGKLAPIFKNTLTQGSCCEQGFPGSDILSADLKNKISAGYASDEKECAGECTFVSLFIEALQEYADYLNSSRPTAVNLNWALKRMMAAAKSAGQTCAAMLSNQQNENSVGQQNMNSSENSSVPVSDIESNAFEHKHDQNANVKSANINIEISGNSQIYIIDRICVMLADEAIKIHNEDIAMCKSISEFGLELVKDGDGILTHCNAGPLATSKYGTALGPILLGTERGLKFHVFADETRPLLQGARLTSYELYNAGVDVTLICDNMANTVMKKGLVNAVFVGSDRIAANGDAANKIGTCAVAILAKYYGIPFYVLAPSSTIDANCKCGDDIIIEERDPEEIKNMFYEKPMALPGVKCFNPAFDVTDHSLVSGIVTEKGIFRPPYNFAD